MGPDRDIPTSSRRHLGMPSPRRQRRGGGFAFGSWVAGPTLPPGLTAPSHCGPTKVGAAQATVTTFDLGGGLPGTSPVDRQPLVRSGAGRARCWGEGKPRGPRPGNARPGRRSPRAGRRQDPPLPIRLRSIDVGLLSWTGLAREADWRRQPHMPLPLRDPVDGSACSKPGSTLDVTGRLYDVSHELGGARGAGF